MKRIHDSLHHVFQRHRIIFWYDATGEWAQTFDAFDDSAVTKLKVSGNEFGTKVRIVRDPDPEAKYLIYLPVARPADSDNWLLDLLLQGHEYKADGASLTIQEAGLPQEFRYLVEDHAAFFRSSARIQSLKSIITNDDTSAGIRFKMMAILAGTEAEMDAMLLHFLHKPDDGLLMDPVLECFDAAALTEPFWKSVMQIFGYVSNTPSLRDFVISLFRSANPLDTDVKLHPHANVFIQRWQDSQKYSNSFQLWSRQMERELRIVEAMINLTEGVALGECDIFEIFDKYMLHHLCLAFIKNTAANELLALIQQRRTSFWQVLHAHGYDALKHAIELRELLASAELVIDSIPSGINRYTSSWWRIDTAYRKCIFHLRKYGQAQVVEQVSNWVEKTYVNNFLLKLSDHWSDQIRKMEAWECEGLNCQRQFFDIYIQPFILKKQKVFVIISDALRFEAASEFASRLLIENRWTTEVEALFGSLPSYTKLGMAALLPGKNFTIDPGNAKVTLDKRSTDSTRERAKILGQACDCRATAIRSSEFIELNSKTAGRDLMRDNEVIYIFHSTIDDISHKLGTEGKAVDAVEQAFEELEQIVKKVANINGTNMLLTADHGFLFQQSDIADEDDTPLPQVDELLYRDRRFILGRGIVPTPSVKIFTSEALGVQGEWAAAFPLSLGRFPLQGSGKRFVHGGPSLQEIVIPVVRIHKARSDDTKIVEVLITRVPPKITTGNFSFALFQERPATNKNLPRTLQFALYSKDGILLSEIKTITFDSKDEDVRRREFTFVLELSSAADAFNNQDVTLRLEETLQGTNQMVTYKSQTIKLQKPFTSDFDEG